MRATTQVPADTTMMRIVHDALRRDLARAAAALDGSGEVGYDRRRAVGAHLTWMMGFLHQHHASEDEGLYPLARERAGSATETLEVLDRMSRQHEAIAGPIADVEAAAAALELEASDGAVGRTTAALEALAVSLLPHLQEEEDVAMPVVSHLVTDAEWQALEQEHNLDSKSFAELGFEGHWLIDSADEADRAAVIALVPAVPRFILLHGFAHSYRRHAAACWAESGKPRRRVQTHGNVAVTVDAAIGDVWDVVCDVTRVGEWSHECVGATWLDGSTAAVPGARFRGRNREGVFRWGRICEVVSADPFELAWRTIATPLFPDSCEWRIKLDEVDGATRIEQTFRAIRAPKALAVLYGLVIPAHRDRDAALVGDLERLGAVAGSHIEA